MRPIATAFAAALAAVLLAASCGGGTADTAPATTAAPATQTEPVTTDGATTAEEEPATTEEEQGEEDGGGADVTATVRVVGGEPQGSTKTIEATSGESVRITVVSDQPGEVHVHGYDLEKEAGPGEPAVFAFVADLEGIFEIESHVSHQVIAKLVVSP